MKTFGFLNGVKEWMGRVEPLNLGTFELFMSLIFSPLFLFSSPLSVGILPFHNTTEDKSYDWLSLGIPDAISDDLYNLEEIKVIERQRMKFLFTEYALAQLGILDDSSLQKVGNFIDADYLIYGDYTITDTLVLITAKITNVKTAEIFEEINVKGSSHRILSLIDSLIVRFVDRIGYKITGAEKPNKYKSAEKALEKLKKNSEKELEEWSSETFQGMLVDALNNMGKRYEKKGKIKRAIACYERSLSIKPDQPMIRLRMNRLKR